MMIFAFLMACGSSTEKQDTEEQVDTAQQDTNSDSAIDTSIPTETGELPDTSVDTHP